MITYIKKNDRLQNMMDRLGRETDITNFNPGSIARSFLEIVNEELEQYYTTLDRYMCMAFLSTSSGGFLDMLGAILNCTRLVDESDNNYRYRISQWVYSTAGANETSIRLKALSVSGVRDIILVPFTHGIGSFSVFVVADNPITPDSILANVQATVNSTRAFGIMAVARRPKVSVIDLKLKVYFNSISSAEGSGVIYDIRNSIKQYIDSLPMGNTFSANQVHGYIKYGTKVSHSEITEMKINGKLTFANSYTPVWDEKVTSGEVIVS